MKLLYSNCVTALTYAAEVRQPSATEMRNMNTAINDAIRRFSPIKDGKAYAPYENPMAVTQFTLFTRTAKADFIVFYKHILILS